MRPRPISSADAGDYYYELDPIFGAKDNSEWQGQLAQQLSLQGEIKEKHFLNLVSGNDLDGKQVVADGVSKKGVAEHRAGFDIPLAAPKSVSIMALHCGDSRLIEAHKQAVAATVNYIENHFLYARRTAKGKTKALQVCQGLFAKFDHSTSRANDPHLHTHTLTLNMVLTDDGYRAVFNDQAFKYQKLLNSVYQGYLAKLTRDIGYGINMQGRGKWEIAGVQDEWIDTFSKRKGEINNEEQLLQGNENLNGEHAAKVRDMAQRNSRAKKDVRISKDELLDLWQNQVPRELISASVEDKKLSAKDIDINESEAVQTAYRAIHESESTFTKQKALEVALHLSRGKYTITDIEESFDQLVGTGELEHLLSLKNKRGIKTDVFTSAQMRQVEQGILETFNANSKVLKNSFDEASIDHFINSNFDYLVPDQRNLVHHILCSPSRFSIIQGDAGTGKTSAVKAVRHLVEESEKQNISSDNPDIFIGPGQQIELVGLGFTGKAAQELEENSGIKSFTLHKFLNQNAPESKPANPSIWIVDESSMVGSLQLNELLKRAIQHNSKIVFVGDGKQLQAIAAGKMFKDLQKYGHVKTLHMKHVLRQKTDHLRKVVGYVANYLDGDDANGIKKAIDVLKNINSITAIKRKEEFVQAVANKYLGYDNREECLVVTPLNDDRLEINQLIHETLKENGISSDKEYDIKMPVSMVGTDRYYASNYAVGYKVFVGESRLAKLKPGQQLTISGVDKDRNTITLKDTNGKDITVDLKGNDTDLSVYQEAKRSFGVGDRIVFTKNDELLGVQNGLTATIERISDTGMMTVALDGNGKHVKFNPYKFGYFDYGYCITGHKSQGQTSKDVLFCTSSGNLLNNSEMFYVAMTRAEQNVFIYLNSAKVDGVVADFEKVQDKSSVLDALNKKSDLKLTERGVN